MSEIRSSAQEVYDAFTDAINGLELFLEDEIEMQRGLVKSCDRTDRGWEANLHAQQILAYQKVQRRISNLLSDVEYHIEYEEDDEIEDERSPLQILFDEISEDLRRLGEKMLAAQTTAEELENE